MIDQQPSGALDQEREPSATRASGVVGYDDLPPQPWPENTEAPPEELADWLTSMNREQLVWLLSTKRMDWNRDSTCFMHNHEAVIERMYAERDVVDADLRAIMAALGISDHARPYSSHEVVQREVIPAIKAALASEQTPASDAVTEPVQKADEADG